MAKSVSTTEKGYGIEGGSNWLSGIDDPISSAIQAPIGSEYWRNNGGTVEKYIKTGALAAEWTLKATGIVGTEDSYQNSFMGKAAGNETPNYSSTNFLAGNEDLEAAMGKVDAEVGPDVTPQVRSGIQLVPAEAIKKHIDDLDAAYGPDADVTNENYWDKALTLLKGLSDLDGQVKVNEDNITGLTTGMNWYPVTPKVITDDSFLNAAADDAVLATILNSGAQVGYFEDDDEPNQLGIGDFADGDYLVSRNNGGTHKMFKVWDDVGTLKVTTAGVTQLVADDVFFVETDLIATPDTSETVAVYRHNGTDIVFFVRITIAAAQAVRLSVGYAAAQGNPSPSDNLESVVAKLDGNLDNVDAILGAIINIQSGTNHFGTAFTGETIPDSSTVQAALQALETKLEKAIIEKTDTLAAATQKTVDTVPLTGVHRIKWDVVVSNSATPEDAYACEVTALAHATGTVDTSRDNIDVIGTNPDVDFDVVRTGSNLELKLTSDVAANVKVIRVQVL